MRRSLIAATAVVAAGAVVGALGVTAVSTAAAAMHPARTSSFAAARQLAGPGAKLWLQRYNGPGNGSDAASSVAVSPDGGAVFVTGQSKGATPATDSSDYLTAAYNAATGAQLWTARYIGSGTYDYATAVAVSPDGATVFVTGSSEQGSGQFGDYATVAYRASDGMQLWVARFNGPANDGDYATAVSMARDGTKVFVTGRSRGADNRISFATVAYRASDGAQLWVAWYAPGNRGVPNAIVSPGGNRVFVTGYVQSKLATAEYGTVAYNATTGAQLWARTYAGQGATSVAASPDRTTVYVTGESHFDFGTLAYNARTGARLWARFYGSHRRIDGASSVAVSPGGRVVVTGTSHGYDYYATVAYSPAGGQLWARRYHIPGIPSPPGGSDFARAVAAPGNGRAYITGASWGGSAVGYDYATIAYNVRTGALLWVKRYNGPANGADDASSLAARGGRVFVTGSSVGTTSGDDYATIAYHG